MLTDYIMPNQRIIFAERRSTPIAKAFGLSDIRLNAARGKIYVFLLADDDAVAIINYLNRGVALENKSI